jgi:hypothetical protein
MPTPLDPEAWATLSENEQQEISTAKQAINHTPGVTPGNRLQPTRGGPHRPGAVGDWRRNQAGVVGVLPIQKLAKIRMLVRTVYWC